jgi:coenzyme F420-reducing hydrogenase alpha subunit
MSTKLNIDVHHLTRVEGHGNIRIRVEGGKLREAVWEIVETPRFFEVMLKGRHYTSAGILTSRICGICSIGHCLASLRATETAFGITIPDAAKKLRLLAKHGETLQSHYLHLFFLAAPDFLEVPSVLPLLEANPEVVHLALRLKGVANRMGDVVAGRSVHPVSLHVGGVSKLPEKKALADLRNQLAASRDDLRRVVELFRRFQIPDFVRETEFVSLEGEAEYPFIGGRIVSSDGVRFAESDYRAVTNEYVTENNTSKWCRLSRESYAVGALARFNNNHGRLNGEAGDIAALLGLSPLSHNPFMNNIAQLVECVHVTHESLRLMDELLALPSDVSIRSEVAPRAGEGAGAVEVPRGILFHHYEYDEKGRIVRADCVIPTTQNNANIQYDLAALVERFGVEGMSDKELERLCSMLVRAYDPCISCSVH